MSLTRQQKEVKVSEATESIASAVSAVFVTYDALQLADMNELRDNLHEAGVSMKVLPKRLLKIALADSKLDFDPSAHEGQMALVWGDDLVSPAKTLAAFAKKHEELQLVGGVMESAVISQDEVKKLATMPSREELLAKLVGTLAGPARGLTTVLSGIPRSMVFVLKAVAEEQKKSE